jgi:hypothetical protein
VRNQSDCKFLANFSLFSFRVGNPDIETFGAPETKKKEHRVSGKRCEGFGTPYAPALI